MPAAKRLASDTTITMRVPSADKRLLEQAARIQGRSVSSFVMEASKARASDVVLDQTHFVLSEEEWARLEEMLDNPPTANDVLRKLMQTKPPWEE